MSAPSGSVSTLFITGAPGSGKTALAKEISELLWRVNEPHAVIDIDELARAVLPETTSNFYLDLAAENLAAVWANYAALGVRRVVLARIIQTAEDLDWFGRAIPGCDMHVCVVRSEPEVIDARLTRREPGLARAFLRQVAAEMDVTLSGLGPDALVVDNCAETRITELAMDVLARLDWPRPLTEH
jgi:chloramphenicol 3-O-phosphotransferase